MADQLDINRLRALDANGDPVPGAKAYFYTTGTTSPLSVYSDQGLTTPHPSPLLADSSGVFPSIYFSGAVAAKVRVDTADDVEVYTTDPLRQSPIGGITAGAVSFTPESPLTSETVQDALIEAASLVSGGTCQCRFSYTSATEVTLSPHLGNLLYVNGAWRSLSAISISNTGLSNSTLYYVYCYNASGTLTLEASETGFSVQSNGIPTKTGDTTRTLVGMVRTNGSGEFESSATYRGVASYFNRQWISATFTETADASTDSTTRVEVGTQINFLDWGDDIVRPSAVASVQSSVKGATFRIEVLFDGANVACGSGGQIPEVNYREGASASGNAYGLLSSGWHYASLYGTSISNHTCNFSHNNDLPNGRPITTVEVKI